MTIKISVVKGNVVSQSDCDGVINSANEYLIAGGGVCGAIYKAAGPELEPFTKKLAPLRLGRAVASPGFNLHTRWIIHTRGPKFHEDPDPPQNLAKALESAVLLADQLEVQRLAIPAISTGVYGYPVSEAAAILIGVVARLSYQVRTIREFRFVLFGGDAYQTFRDVANQVR